MSATDPFNARTPLDDASEVYHNCGLQATPIARECALMSLSHQQRGDFRILMPNYAVSRCKNSKSHSEFRS